MTDVLVAFLEGTVRAATPLALAALGETISERGGVINIGLEGAVIGGAFAAVVAGLAAGPTAGFLAGAASGAAVGALLALFVVTWHTEQIITGTAITAGMLGLTALLYHTLFGAAGAALNVTTMPPAPLPLLARLPVVGPAFFRQPPVTYLVYGLVPALWFVLYRTRLGLTLRAVGEAPEAARVAGHSPARVRFGAVVVGSALGGLGGATLVLAQVGTFAEGMSAGRGFIALAVVALGRWQPVGVALAALVFGGATALQHFFQASATRVPYQFFLALPYLLTLAVLARSATRRRAPAALGRPLPPLAG